MMARLKKCRLVFFCFLEVTKMNFVIDWKIDDLLRMIQRFVKVTGSSK